MPNLRLLKFYRHLFGQKKQDPVFTVESSQSNNLLQLPHRLRLLHWEEYPFESLPLKFSMQNLVDLTLTDSSIIQFWDGKGPENLKRLDLSHSVQLGRLPDLSSAKKMEKICLEDCQSLVEIPYSIQCLHNLTDLFLRWCTNLRSIPNMAMLISLKRLNLSYCSNLKMLPEVPKDIEWIELEQSGVEEWSSIPVWEKVAALNMKNCKNLASLPSLVHLKSLGILNLSGCSNLTMLPEIPNCIKRLELQMSGIVEWSPCIGTLENLRFLDMRFCKNMRSFPSLIHSKSLHTIYLHGCINLTILPEVPSSVKFLELENSGLKELKGFCNLSKFPDFTANREKLILDELAIQELPSSIRCFSSSLNALSMHRCKSLEILPDSICELKCLRSLDLSDCLKLAKLPPLNGLNSLEILDLNKSAIVEIPAELPSSLVELRMECCRNVKILPDSICELKCLQILNLKGCLILEKLPPLDGLNSLEKLNLTETAIVEIPAELPSSLVELSMEHCRNLKILPNSICELKCLPILNLNGCLRLEKLPPLDGLNSLEKLNLNDTAIVEIPAELPPSLVDLSMEHCRNVKFLPNSICELKCLKGLILNGCLILEKLPPLDGLNSLEMLDLTSCAIEEIPTELPPSLRMMRLEYCRFLRILPVSIFGLKKLQLCIKGCSKLFKLLPLDALKALLYRAVSGKEEIIKEISIKSQLSYRVSAVVRKQLEWLNKH
ncbi:Disease resistance protein (TIR-NBS-LRR class) family [Euphorbia peplus]|nr:Disease resistance protein (TIR-NBS-LRR class) family [Euphorbia peplus]